MAVILKPHQAEVLTKIKNGSVIKGGVGSGKTHASLAYFVTEVCGGSLDGEQPMATPHNLVVITTAKKRDDLDWQSTAMQFYIFDDPEISYGGVGVVVDSWNNIPKYVDVENTFFIFDEQRVPGSGAWVKAFLKIVKRNPWILLSATPADTWLDYVPLFLAHGFFRTRSEFIEDHVIWTFHGRYRKIKGFYDTGPLKKYRDSILVEMPYEKHTTRHLVVVETEYDLERFDKVWKSRWNVYLDEPLVDVAEMHRIGRKVVNSDPSRSEKVFELLKKHPRLIIFYNFNYELDILREDLEGHVEVAEWNGQKHQPVPKTDSWVYLVQYAAGAEGWNCTDTDAIVFYSLTYSHKVFEQSQGRIDRMDTPYYDLYYYVFISKAKIDTLIWKALTTKKNFHEGRNTKFNQAA